MYKFQGPKSFRAYISGLHALTTPIPCVKVLLLVDLPGFWGRGWGGKMTVDDVVALGWNALLVTLLMAAPMLLSGLMVGLAVSILQSVTQVQEMTLAFVPKIVAVMLAFILFLPWIMATLLNFVQPLFGNFDMLVR